MKLMSALLIGFASGLLLYFGVGAFIIGGSATPQEAIFRGQTALLVLFLGGWVVTTYAVLRDVRTTARVWARGSLIGAAEWMAVGMLAVWWSGHTLVKVTAATSSSATLGGAGLGAGLFSIIGLGLAAFMAVICLIIYFIASHSEKEFAPEVTRVACPKCAELIVRGATQCRFCGATV